MFAVAIRILEHGRIVVGALANQYLRVVVSLRSHVLAEVPLADHRGGVASLAQKLGKGLLGTVELVAVHKETVGVRVLACLDRGPHGTADGVGHVALLEEHAIPGQRIDVGRGGVLLEPGIVGPDRLVGVVVREDEQNVRSVGRENRRGGSEGQD